MSIEKFTRKGKEFAIIPVEDLRRLMDDAEMLADIKAYVAAKGRLDRGDDELIRLKLPSAVSPGKVRSRSDAIIAH